MPVVKKKHEWITVTTLPDGTKQYTVRVRLPKNPITKKREWTEQITFPTITEAKDYRDKLVGEKRAMKADPKGFLKQAAQQTLVKDIIGLHLENMERHHYRDVKGAKEMKRDWEMELGDKLACTVTGDMLQEIGDKWAKTKKLANRTINKKVSALLKCFRLALKKGLVTEIPDYEKREESEPREGFMEWDTFAAIREKLPLYAQLPATIGYFVGLRLSEVTSLTRSQIVFEHDEETGTPQVRLLLHARSAKAKRAREAVFPSEFRGDLYDMLKTHMARNEAEYPGVPWVCPYKGERLGTYKKAWRKACVELGLATGDWKGGRAQHHYSKYVGPIIHDMRRSAVRNMVRRGVPEVVAMRITGHKTRSVFDRYNIVSERDMVEAGRKITQGHREKEARRLTLVPKKAAVLESVSEVSHVNELTDSKVASC